MNLWFSTVFLVVGFFLSSSAQADEECATIVKPFSTYTPMWGRWIFIAGYSDNEIYDAMFKSAQSQWIDWIQTSESPNQYIQNIGIRHPSYCKYGSHPVILLGNSALSQRSNFTCTFHSLPTCEGCLLYQVTALNNNNLIDISDPTSKEELRGYRALYLMTKGESVKDSDLEHFKKQAHCLGYKGEPTFVYDKEHTLCEKGDEGEK